MHLNIDGMPPGAQAATLACAILAAQADRLDALSASVAEELDRVAHSRTRIGELITRLIDELDDIEGDPDLEPYLADLAPGLGDDREGEGGVLFAADADFEPPLGWTDREARLARYGHRPDGEDEPTLGAGENHPAGACLTSTFCFGGVSGHTRRGDQSFWAGGPTPLRLDDVEDVDERESENEDGGDVADELHDDLGEDLELTSIETQGRGFTAGGSPALTDDDEDPWRTAPEAGAAL